MSLVLDSGSVLGAFTGLLLLGLCLLPYKQVAADGELRLLLLAAWRNDYVAPWGSLSVQYRFHEGRLGG